MLVDFTRRLFAPRCTSEPNFIEVEWLGLDHHTTSKTAPNAKGTTTMTTTTSYTEDISNALQDGLSERLAREGEATLARIHYVTHRHGDAFCVHLTNGQRYRVAVKPLPDALYELDDRQDVPA